jgi:sulfite exporter TauE/SafE
MELLTGFLLGLLGSFHCVGMCGPIVLALPVNKTIMRSRLLYNSGRLATYSMLGLIFGLFGSKLEIFGLQQIVSLALGCMIIVSTVIPRTYRYKITSAVGINKMIPALKLPLSRLFKQHSILSMLSIGILNGLLPCGFVYLGIRGSCKQRRIHVYVRIGDHAFNDWDFNIRCIGKYTNQAKTNETCSCFDLSVSGCVYSSGIKFRDTLHQPKT